MKLIFRKVSANMLVPTWSQGINEDTVMSHETKLDYNHAMQLMITTSQNAVANITVILVTFTKNKREMTMAYVTTIQGNKTT